LTSQRGLILTTPVAHDLETLRQDEAFHSLGSGEQESIALALATENALLLSNDNKARQLATALGATVINIPAFLLACKLSGELTRDAIQQIIDDLWQKDYYKFRKDVQEQLLA
jgi:predicted nucleic acid-binding protein